MKIFPKDADNIDKFQIILSMFLRFTLIVAIILGIFRARYTIVFASSLILIFTFLPLMFERRYKIMLPLEFESIIIAFIYASIFLGEIRGYYGKFWWWDVALHTGSGIALGFAGFMILYTLYFKNKIHTHPAWMAVFSFFFAIGLGAIWEMFEFAVDQLFGFHMQGGSLADTMWDLIVDSFGALLTSIVGYFYFKNKQLPLFSRLIKKFEKENPKYFK